MTRTEFIDLLKKNNINENLVVFDDVIKEGVCVTFRGKAYTIILTWHTNF